jgi:hypothetical protein
MSPLSVCSVMRMSDMEGRIQKPETRGQKEIAGNHSSCWNHSKTIRATPTLQVSQAWGVK